MPQVTEKDREVIRQIGQCLGHLNTRGFISIYEAQGIAQFLDAQITLNSAEPGRPSLARRVADRIKKGIGHGS